MTGTPIVDRYVESVRTRNLTTLMALFAEDATVVLPDGKAIQGAPQIRALFTALLEGNAPYPTPVFVVDARDRIAVELQTKVNDGTQRQSCNFYELDAAGQVRRLSIYVKGS